MEFFILNRSDFSKEVIVDKFDSAIWTERYYGDSEIGLVVPATQEMIDLLPEGTFLGEVGSEEVMELHTPLIEDGKLKISGSSLLLFLNNRFVRASNSPEARYWIVPVLSPGEVLAKIVHDMCIDGDYLDGSIDTGIPDPAKFKLTELDIGDVDSTGSTITVPVPYGPVYDALKDIAETYKVGMRIVKVTPTASPNLRFEVYRGTDLTSSGTSGTIIQFSMEMDSLTNIKELRSIKDFKNDVYAFAPANPGGYATDPGESKTGDFTGFDLRTSMIFADDISTDQFGGSSPALIALLNERAKKELKAHPVIKAVDGEITSLCQFKYGRDYHLGDLVEAKGYTGIVQKSRVTEYIRTQDNAGERAYPTLTIEEA